MSSRKSPRKSSRLTSHRTAGFGLALLTAAALAGAPAHAQDLTLGYTNPLLPWLTTSGSGIISALGTAASGVYTYSNGASAATSNYDSVDVTGDVTVHSGGSITSLTLESSYFQSTAMIDGGNVTSITTEDGSEFGQSTLNISGGTVGDVSEYNFGYGDVTAISGGHVTSLLSHAGTVTISGGSLDSLDLEVGNIDRSEYVPAFASITSGSVGSVSATGILSQYLSDQPHVVATTCDISGGTFGSLTAADYGGFDITGSDLRLTPESYVTGFLSNGSVIDAKFTNTDGLGFLTFNGVPVAPVPEASSVISLGLLLVLGLGGLAVSRRRTGQAAA